MFTICCTSKVLKRTGFPIESPIPEPTTALGNWYVNLLFIQHTQLLLFTSDTSRLAVVTPAREIKSLVKQLTRHLAVLLEGFGAEPEWIKSELHEMSDVRYSTTHSRSILGTMNDYKM